MTSATKTQDLAGWFAGRLPDDWFTEPPEVTTDREEILVVGRLAEPDYPKDADDAAKADGPRRPHPALPRGHPRAAHAHRRRSRAAHRPQGRVGRACAATSEACSPQLAVPVMTRLRMSERQVLDTLVGAGVARSRSDALAWCVRLVRDHEGEWIDQLRDALVAVHEARATGPKPSA